MVGFRHLVFRFKNGHALRKLYVVKEGPSVLGWKDQRKLNILLNSNSTEQFLMACEGKDTRKWVLDEFPSVFNGKIGKLRGFTHRIRLKSHATPKIHRAHNIPFIVKGEVEMELEKLGESCIIEPVEALEWGSPLVVARQYNGKVRLCVDLRWLNNNIVVDQFPLPRIDEMLTLTRNAKRFSTLDLSAAYHQVVLDLDRRPLSAFCMLFCCYQFRHMPFGLVAAVCQTLMTQLFGSIPEVTFFQDNILIMDMTKKHHDEVLRKVLNYS